MEPLSIAASVAGLLSLTLEVSKTLDTYIGSVKNAPTESLRLAQEVSTLASTLGSLGRFLQAQAPSSPQHFGQTSALVAAASSCHDTLGTLRATLGKFLDKAEGKKWYKRLAWPIKRDEHVRIVDAVRRFTQIFQFSLSIEGWYVVLGTQDRIGS